MKLIQTRLDDSVVERDFQLRMKDVSYGDQIKELTETFVAEANLLMDKYLSTFGHCRSFNMIYQVS